MAQNGSGTQESSTIFGYHASWECCLAIIQCQSGDMLLCQGSYQPPSEAVRDTHKHYHLPGSLWHESGTAPVGCPQPWLMIFRHHHILQKHLISSWTLPCPTAPFLAQLAAYAAAHCLLHASLGLSHGLTIEHPPHLNLTGAGRPQT